eukprot:1726328-Pleurochrysis_carterae.AAC.2
MLTAVGMPRQRTPVPQDACPLRIHGMNANEKPWLRTRYAVRASTSPEPATLRRVRRAARRAPRRAMRASANSTWHSGRGSRAWTSPA